MVASKIAPPKAATGILLIFISEQSQLCVCVYRLKYRDMFLEKAKVLENSKQL